jgi:hypothetical protein
MKQYFEIVDVMAREILDSRGNPTVEVEVTLDDKYIVRLGSDNSVEYKFGMLISALSQLLEGDVGIINVSDGNTAHFSPT